MKKLNVEKMERIEGGVKSTFGCAVGWFAVAAVATVAVVAVVGTGGAAAAAGAAIATADAAFIWSAGAAMVVDNC